MIKLFFPGHHQNQNMRDTSRLPGRCVSHKTPEVPSRTWIIIHDRKIQRDIRLTGWQLAQQAELIQAMTLLGSETSGKSLTLPEPHSLISATKSGWSPGLLPPHGMCMYLNADSCLSLSPAGEDETCQNNCAFKNLLGKWTMRYGMKDKILGS